ncbi:MAG: sugar phosphate nucleotidyltransferase [Deltaproteobacteria bacterium]|nr:sugar phosphate nucleotidyltransferase [Deltaproteobacteria bacterium]
MILAAGLGTRLRPLTEHTPKILVPLAGQPMLDRLTAFLVGRGVSRVAVNTHYLADQVAERLLVLAARYPRVAFQRFHEPDILGTGGGVANLGEFWGKSDLLVWNGDIVAEVDVRALFAAHRSALGGERPLATLVLQDRPSNSRLVVDAFSRIVGIDSPRRNRHQIFIPPQGQTQTLAYNGIALLSPSLRPLLPPPDHSYDLIDALLAVLEQGRPLAGFNMGAGFFGTTGNLEQLRGMERAFEQREALAGAFSEGGGICVNMIEMV